MLQWIESGGFGQKKNGDAHFATVIKTAVWLDYFGGLILMIVSSV